MFGLYKEVGDFLIGYPSGQCRLANLTTGAAACGLIYSMGLARPYLRGVPGPVGLPALPAGCPPEVTPPEASLQFLYFDCTS